MKESILRRHPELTSEDVVLRDDGDEKGIYLDYWNSEQPKPTMDQILLWVEEDNRLPQPKTEIEELKEQQSLMQQAIDDLILGGIF